MKRILAPAALAVAIGVVSVAASGCNANWSSATAPAASLNGQTVISVRNLMSQVNELRANKPFLCAAGAPSSDGVVDGSVSTYFVDQELTPLISDAILSYYATSMKLYVPTSGPLASVASSEVIEQDTARLSELTQESVNCGTTGAELFHALPADVTKELVAAQEVKDAVNAQLAGTSMHPSALAAFASSHPLVRNISCLDVLQTSKADVAKIAKAFKKHESWATIVKAYQQNTELGPNGEYTCAADYSFPDNLGSFIDSSPVGRPNQKPVTLQGDYLYFYVTKRTTANTLELVDGISGLEEETFNSLEVDGAKSADVSVDPQFGSWTVTTTSQSVTAQVTPSGAAALSNAPNPVAAGQTTTTTTQPSELG